MRRNILVAGATGKQGQALVRALIDPQPPALPDKDHEYHVYALTRKASSPTAQHLAELGADITIVEGDLDAPESITQIFEDAKLDGGIWGVFAVLAFPGLGANADGEERQGKLLADLALEYGVKAFIYSSAMRSGPKYEAGQTLSGRAKADVDEYCISLGERGLPWILLRPGFFMENWDEFIGSIAASVLKKGLKEDTTVGIIASEDIGHVAAGVFKNHEKYIHKTLVAVSEFATMSQLEEAHQEAIGKPMPAIPGAFGWALVKMNKATQQLIESIELNHYARMNGEYPTYEAEVALASSAYRMQTYYEYVQMKQVRKETGNGGGNWNQVSIAKLVTGRS